MFNHDASRSMRRDTVPARGGRFAAALLLAAGLPLLGACGSDDDRAGPSPDDLVAAWAVIDDDVTWEVTEDLISTTFGGGIDTQYTATATTLELGPETGEFACPPGQIGMYEWEIVDDVLTLTAVSDRCTGRKNVMDGIALERGT